MNSLTTLISNSNIKYTTSRIRINNRLVSILYWVKVAMMVYAIDATAALVFKGMAVISQLGR